MKTSEGSMKRADRVKGRRKIESGGARRFRVQNHPQVIHSRVFLALSQESDNECYVNLRKDRPPSEPEPDTASRAPVPSLEQRIRHGDLNRSVLRMSLGLDPTVVHRDEECQAAAGADVQLTDR